ncbi:MAG: Fur family transcriptional regulator [Candidatus Sulfobium sp.]|jgi:Fur family transcriptional regulator, ferric uptake regulator
MEQKIFRDFLGRKGLKLTRERMSVLREVFSFHDHFDPENLYLRIRGSGLKASRASVYRTLSLLVESGLVRLSMRTERGNIYEHRFGHGHHDHMICNSCGKIIEFYSEKLENIQDEICDNNKFDGVSHTLEIRGICERCGKQGNKRRQEEAEI